MTIQFRSIDGILTDSDIDEIQAKARQKWDKILKGRPIEEVRAEWREKYKKLKRRHPGYVCVEKIADEYDCDRDDVITQMNIKEYDPNKYGIQRDEYGRYITQVHNSKADYSRHYMRVSRHIDEFIENAFCHDTYSKTHGPFETLTLEQVSESIKAQTGIKMSPETILKLDRKYAETNDGKPVLWIDEIDGKPGSYRLNILCHKI